MGWDWVLGAGSWGGFRQKNLSRTQPVAIPKYKPRK